MPLDYVFTIKLEHGRQFDSLISDVAGVIFRDLGCEPGMVTAVVNALDAALGPSLDDGIAVDLQFNSAGGTCEVLIKAGNREIWRTSVHP